jgi:Iap family predicted aminopeptidase
MRKNFKVLLSLVMVVVLVLSSGATALAGSEAGGQAGMIPVRAAFEMADVKVDWDHKTKTVLVGSNHGLKFTIGSKTMMLDGIPFEMERAAVLIGGKTYVDASTMTNIFGAETEDGSVRIPDYAADLLSGEFKSKAELYQQPVPGENAFLAALNPQTGWDVARELVKIGSSDLGFRLGGTPEGKAAADVIYKKYQELGLQPEYHTFKTYGWRYLDSSFSLEGSDLEIPVVSAVGSKGTPDAGITGEVVYIGTATKQELEGVDLTGKIALIKMDLDYHPWHSQGAYAAAIRGAAGVIYYCENYYAQLEGGEAFNAQDWSGAEIDIPVLNTPKKYGEQLVKMVTEKPYRATLVSKVEINEKGDGYNVIGKIVGKKWPNEYVIVNAHTDAHFQGFQDDSIAIGGVVAIAEALKKSGYEPDRTLLFLSMDAEEFGAMDLGPDWLLGSWNMMKDKNGEWAGRAVASLTIELFAYKGTENFELRASDTLHEYVLNTAKGFDYQAYAGLGVVKNEISNMSDEFSFAYYGIPTFRTNTDPYVVENIYHTQFDNEETTSFEKYGEALSHYAKLFIRLDKMPVAPYDLTLGIEKYRSGVDFDELNNLGLGTELKALAEAYQQKSTELYFKNAMILKLYEEAVKSGRDLGNLQRDLSVYNQKVRDVNKTYLTGTLALSGETVTLEIPYYQGIPRLFDDAVAALKSKDGERASELLSGLKGSYYADYQDYETWFSINRDNINPDNPNRDTLWSEGIKVQYFDHYKMTQGLKEKLAAGGAADYSEEIKTCETFKQIAMDNLRKAYQDDLKMFRQANSQFPLEEADRIIELLK